MYLHLGRDVAVLTRSIIAVIDLDTCTHSRHTRAFLTQEERGGRVITVSEDLPKSAVICEDAGVRQVYISQISSRTLLKRAQGGASALREDSQ